MDHVGPIEILAAIAMLVGLVGCIVPVIPGTPLVWAALAGYDVVAAVRHELTRADVAVLVLATALAVVGTTAEWWLSSLAARRGGASGRTTTIALVAGLLALVLLPASGPLAIALAMVLPAAVVVVLEFRRHRDANLSFRAGCGFVAGWVLAVAVNLAAGVGIVALWVWQVSRGGPL